MSDCVGFIECPCAKCRETRRAATAEHPQHDGYHGRAYCGACRTARRLAHEAPERQYDNTCGRTAR